MRRQQIAHSSISTVCASLCLLLAAGCEQPRPAALTFQDSLARRDIDAAMMALSATAKLDLEGVTYTGAAEIRAALEKVSVLALSDDAKQALTALTARDGDVTWLQPYSTAIYETLGVTPVEAQVQATLANGMIETLRWNLTADAAAKVRTARSARVTKVIDSLQAALNGHNVEAALALLDEGAGVEWLDQKARGQEQLTGWLKGLAEKNTRIERVNDPNVTDQSATWQARMTTGEQADPPVAPLDVTALVETREGKIARFTLAVAPTAEARPTAEVQPQQPAQQQHQ